MDELVSWCRLLQLPENTDFYIVVKPGTTEEGLRQAGAIGIRELSPTEFRVIVPKADADSFLASKLVVRQLPRPLTVFFGPAI